MLQVGTPTHAHTHTQQQGAEGGQQKSMKQNRLSLGRIRADYKPAPRCDKGPTHNSHVPGKRGQVDACLSMASKSPNCSPRSSAQQVAMFWQRLRPTKKNVLIEIDERRDVVVVNTVETGNQGVTKISKCLLHVHVPPQYFPLRFMSARKLEELSSMVLLFRGPKIVNFIEPS